MFAHSKTRRAKTRAALGHLIIHAVLIFSVASITRPASAAGNNADNANQNDLLFFDIPAETLTDALGAYSADTGEQVLVDDDLIAPFKSTSINGLFTREDALDTLLKGTGLTARLIGQDAVTLEPDRTATAPPPTDNSVSPQEAQGEPPGFNQYSAAIQATVMFALCGSVGTRPGSYRLLIQLWIDRHGNITHSRLLNSTGSRVRDAALTRLFGNLSVGITPPAGLPQPVTLLILPRAAGDCE
jgi:hypothetical protein